MSIILETVWFLASGVTVSRVIATGIDPSISDRIVTFIFRRNPDASINGNTRTCGDSELVLSTIVPSLYLFSSVRFLCLSLSPSSRVWISHLDLHRSRVGLKITHPDTSDFVGLRMRAKPKIHMPSNVVFERIARLKWNTLLNQYMRTIKEYSRLVLDM